MADDERDLRTTFRNLELPPAPASLRARLAGIAARPAMARPRPWRSLSLPAATALVVLVLVGLAVSTGGPRAQQSQRPSPGALTHFDGEGLAFDYPATWREFHYHVESSFSHVIAYLATVDVPVPCETIVNSDSTEIDCADRYSLTPDSLIVAITANGRPGFSISNLPAGALPLTIGGLPGYLEVTKVGGDMLSLVWILTRPESVDNYYQISATVRGPTAETLQAQLQALIASLRYDPPVAMPGPTATPIPTGIALSAPLPNPGGTCSASQFVLGTPTHGYGFGTLGSTVVFVTVPLRNAGGNCVLELPEMIGVAAATGPFHAVPVIRTGTATAWASESGQSLPIVIGASWWVGVRDANGNPVRSAPPCADPIFDVTRVELPFAFGSTVIDLPTTWHEVCSSPASVSVTLETK